MGESACLVRSFSQPADIFSGETDKGDFVRTLTESVSFGRFVSESLAWEKWSTFSHNRYLEEVEKFAKPGSVAQKKAFFEAHYKKRAAMKTTQKKLEEANVTNRNVQIDENAVESQKDHPIDSQFPVMVTPSVVNDKVRLGENCGTKEEEDGVIDVKFCNSISQMQVKTEVETGEVKDNPMENLEQIKIAESYTEVSVYEDKVRNEVNPTSSSQEKRARYSSGSKASGGRLRLTPSCARGLDSSDERSVKDVTSSCKKSTSVTKKQKRLTLESNREFLHMPQGSPKSSTIAKAAVEEDKKKRTVPSNFASSRCQMSKTGRKDPVRSSTMREATSSNVKNTPRSSARTKTTREADKRKILLPSSVHTSIVFAASPRQEIPIRSSTREETTSSKARNNLRSGATAKAAGEADKKKASVVRLPQLPLKNQLSKEDKRKNMIVGSSISVRLPNNEKKQSFVNQEKLSTPNGFKARSCTVSSPFSLRSDERAAKRKEYLKKLEEKNKNAEAEKDRLLSGLKIPPTRLSSPSRRQCRNQHLCLNNNEKCQQPPQKISSAITRNTKNAAGERHRSSKIHPFSTTTSLQKRKTRENLSPNFH